MLSSALSRCIFHSVSGLYFSTCIVLRIQMRGRPELDCMWFWWYAAKRPCGNTYAKPPVLWPIPVCQKSADKHIEFQKQCCGSGTSLHGSPIYFGSRRAKMAELSGFEELDVLFFLRAEGFSCSLNVWRPRNQ
jgi:hypothetical protein